MTAQRRPTSPSSGAGGAPAAAVIAPCPQCPAAAIVFSESTQQKYGYDDFDTRNTYTDDHVSIKKSDYTFVKVDIRGGVGTDFEFVCDDRDICRPGAPEASASFHLRLDAGSYNKISTTLRARCKCANHGTYARITVHVYKERLVDVVVAKIFDGAVPATNLKYPDADYAAHTAAVNDKAKAAVVKYSITNHDPSNRLMNVRYDRDGNGSLSFDINAGGGPEFQAIQAAMRGTGSKTRVAIVRSMKSYYYLAGAAPAGATTLTVASSRNVFNFVGHTVQLGGPSTAENVTIAGISGNTVTLSRPLANAQPAGAGLEFPAGGWSTDPIIIIEGNNTLDVVKWTIAHETGHRPLTLLDVEDSTDVMHFSQSWSDHRLRYCLRNLKHQRGTENQWDKIPR